VDANLLLGFPADQRDYTTGARILEDMGVRRVRLLTNNPDKIAGLEACGIKVEERIPIVAEPRRENELYLAVKKRRLGHLLDAGGCE
jgi:3,4-dihydroxy 2-butanone 4-phosphate synthase/GTP cyclohydrolase II